MARINLLQSGAQGIDMKSNPLLIGAKQKLRFATNMIFEEGVVRSRPGFRYENLCCSGQFQGAVDFQPTRGLSYQPFGEGEGIAIVVRGSLHLNGEKLTGNIFKGKGPVNLFQAENYLIVQNTETSTYWWDGFTLTQSPGMNEVDFAEIETPVHEMEIVRPVAVIPPCAGGGGGGGGCDADSTEVIIYINDDTTENPIDGATLILTLNENEVSVNISEDGRVILNVPQDLYFFTVTKEGYDDVGPTELNVTGCSEHFVRMGHASECSLEFSDNEIDPGDNTLAQFTVTNAGETMELLSLISSTPLISVSPEFPLPLNSGESATFDIVASGPLAGENFDLVSNCGTFGAAYGSGATVNPFGVLRIDHHRGTGDDISTTTTFIGLKVGEDWDSSNAYMNWFDSEDVGVEPTVITELIYVDLASAFNDGAITELSGGQVSVAIDITSEDGGSSEVYITYTHPGGVTGPISNTIYPGHSIPSTTVVANIQVNADGTLDVEWFHETP